MPSYITVRIQKDGWDIATSISVPVREEWSHEEAVQQIKDRIERELDRYAIAEVLKNVGISEEEARTQ
ncbi:hypothetical protein [Schlesneria sp. T3-172]|uniref:hypothetical protein n=1 Tax=Schlesneria sphaerica TaxID=3373610 RepID=UPI0037C7B37B